MPLDELTARAEDLVREYEATRDRGVLFSAEADRDAAALWTAVRAVDLDTASPWLDARFTAASTVLGRLHHLRYRAAGEGRGLADLARALLCLEPVADDYHAVPLDVNTLVGRATHAEDQAETGTVLLRASAGGGSDPALLDAAILLMEPAAGAAPRRGLVRGARLSHLCLAFRRRHERDGTAADLDRAVAAGEESVAIADAHGEEATEPWAHLARAYRCRYLLRGDAADLRRVIDLFERVLDMEGPSAALLSDLGTAYRDHHGHTGDPAHIEKAVDLAERAAALPGGEAGTGVLAGLGRSLLRRYETSGAKADLWRAAEIGERVVAALPDGDPEGPGHLASVASVLLERHRHGQAPGDLDRAVDLTERALSALPEEDPRRPDVLRGLAAALHRRYLGTGTGPDLDRAATLGAWALAAIPDGHPGRAGASMELAGIHLTRYARSGVLADLAQAIELGERVAAGTGETPEWASLLGRAYRRRYRATGDIADLDRAIDLGGRALAGTGADDVALAGRRARLAAAHLRRHAHAGDRADLERAIDLGESAVAATPDCHLDLPGRLAGLAGARLARYRLDRDPADVDAAVDLGERALAGVPADHPERAALTAGLCAAYLDRLDGGGRPPGPERLHALAAAAREARTVAPADRVAAHHAAGALAEAAGDDRLAVTLLDGAAALLPSVAPREAGWADQQHRIGEHGGLVGTGVAAHCAVGDAAGAVEFAELGRGVLLASQANTRAGLAALEDRDPRLAGRFRWVCERLNTPDFPAGERRRWWADHDALLAEIRALPGLEGFLAAPRLADLRAAAEGGYAVLVNAGRDRGDAVIVRADGDPVPVTLPGLRRTEAEARVAALLAAVGGGPSLAGVLRRRRVVPQVLGWLWDTAVEPVAHALRTLRPHGAARVWWLPTGLLGLLPLHAAGHPGKPGALDAMVSSFVPSLRALRDARDRPPATSRRHLTVALHHTPGLRDLPGAAREAAVLDGPVLADEQATAGRVLSALGEATWAHFACHAVADPVSQADGGLRLHDRTLRLPEVGGLRLDGAELAYLSACSTADHGTRYADEVLHLASAFQFAGFRHVVASLWPLADEVAVSAARRFYRGLPGTPVADDAASVLHEVTLGLRDEHPDRPDLWAPLVHSGP
ncbi:CHAT domain-containing protein [Actinomadura graeca]|uniref:CHAT domain-containing protein n=1 Tax=Actinomadura graeca TaxID=2750812 RepID=A0ABX8QZP7_9ACTN|nr:CHAT domain-containing protein [Actinomadura graeca]QXJ24286.1 CHAT domain-containing protein [Actinomadura graeca]